MKSPDTPEVDIFSTLVDEVETERLLRAVEARTIALRDQQNREFIALGQAAVANGITKIQAVENVWAVVRRQYELIKAGGTPKLGPEYNPRNERYSVKGTLVRVAPDIGVVLSYESFKEGPDFWAYYEEEGLDYAVLRVAKPFVTGATIFDLKTNQPVSGFALDPAGFKASPSATMEEWCYTHPFANRVFLQPELADRLPIDHINETLDEKDLIMAAGYAARYDLFLDEVEAHL